MKVDTGMRYQPAAQQPRAAGASASKSFAATLAATLAATQAASATQADGATQADKARQVDFTGMTRQDMRDWVNTQIRSGDMSLDESRPLMAMTMKVPVGGAVEAEHDARLVDFTQLARDGIQGALARNDQTTLKMLQSALSIMQGQQGSTTGVDRYA